MNDEDRKRISAALKRLFDCAFETSNELLAVLAKTGLGSPSAHSASSSDQADTPEGLITAADAAELLSSKTNTLYELVRRKRIPHYRIGKNIRFRCSELLAWARADISPNQ